MKLKSSLIMVCLSWIILGCKKEGCTYTDASNYNSEAEVDDGSCVFPDPEPEPEPDPREAYLGNYSIVDSSFGGGTTFVSKITYTLSVTTNNTVADTLYLNNLCNKGQNFYAVLNGTSFLIPSQTDVSPFTLHGDGSFSGSQISYHVYSGPGNDFLNRGKGSK